MQTPDTLLRFWLRLQEPRVISALQGVTYVLVVVAGGLALRFPPLVIETAIGSALVVMWAVALLLGGALGAVSVAAAAWWLERVALIFIFTAEAMLLVTTATAPHATGTKLLLVMLTTWITLSTAQRAVRIRSYPYDPER